MNREEISMIIEKIITDKTGISNSVLLAKHHKISLLDPLIGLRPRDLLTVYFEVEAAFSVKFTEHDIEYTRLDYIENMTELVFGKLKLC